MAGRKPMIQKFTNHILTNEQVHFRAFRAHVSPGFTGLFFLTCLLSNPTQHLWWILDPLLLLLMGSYSYYIGLKSLFCPKFLELYPEVKKIFFVVHFSHGRKGTWLYSIKSSLRQVILSHQSLLIDFYYFRQKENFYRRSFYYVYNLTLFVFQSLHLCEQYSHYPSYRTRWRCGLHHESSWFISLQWLMWRWSKYYAVVSTGNTDSNLETRTSKVLLCKERYEKQMTHGLNEVFVPQKEQNF